MSRARSLPALAAGLVLLAAVASGCSAPRDEMAGMPHGDHSASDSAATAAGVDDADVMFAQMMVPHHEQAVEMSDMLLAKDGIDDRVRALAEDIRDAQAPEIETMRTWLEEWGAPAEGGHDGHTMDGMMTDADMTALDEATGTDAALLFLEQMQRHHEGAIAMAEDEIADGEDADAVALAEEIRTTQAAEIATMQELSADLAS